MINKEDSAVTIRNRYTQVAAVPAHGRPPRDGESAVTVGWDFDLV
jgi:hypothetical protein